MYGSSIAQKSSSKIDSSKLFRNQFSSRQEDAHQPSIQEYLQSQNDTKIQTFKQSLNRHPGIETIQFQDDSRYFGQITQDSIRQGIGIFETSDGDIYMGDWINDTYHGYGMYIYNDGQRYEGELVEGMKEGEGKYFYLDGKVYEGMWNYDQREGQGIQRDTAKGIYYQGEWLEEQKHGSGKICLLNPTDWGFPASEVKIMEGTWQKNVFSSGVIQTEIYKGQFSNQTLTGQGSYKFSDGSIYQGNFISNLMQGKGTYYYSNGDVYEGEFFCGLKHGKGVYKYFSGDVYTGGYEKDIKHGEGRFAFVNGNYYVGDFQRDCFHGKGKYFFTQDQVLSGWWENGKFVKDQNGDDKSDQIGFNRKMVLLNQNGEKGDRTPRNDRSRSPLSKSPMNRNPVYQSPMINSFSNTSIGDMGRSGSPFGMQRNGPVRQQKAGMISVNPSRSPISKSKFMEVHTPGESYFKAVNGNQEIPSSKKKVDPIREYDQQRSIVKKNNESVQDERYSDRRLFDMLNEGEIEVEQRQRERQRRGDERKSDNKRGSQGQNPSIGINQQAKKISKKFQR